MASPDPRHRRVRNRRSTELDRALAGSRTVAAIGPVADLDPEHVAAILDHAWSPSSRLSLVPDAAARRWRAAVRPPVVQFGPADDSHRGDIGAVVTAIRNRPGVRGPLEILICGDHLVVDYSHGLGDGRLGVTLLTTLAGPPDTAAAEALTHSLPPDAVWQALRRVFLRTPGRVRTVLRLRSANERRTPTTDGATRPTPAGPSRRSMVGHMTPDTVAALRDRVAAHSARVGVRLTTASVTVALWRTAIARRVGGVDENTMVLVDCRRYLDDRHQADMGNLAVGIGVHLPTGAAPDDIATRLRAVTESGWPAAVLAIGELRDRVPGRGPHEPPPWPTSVGDRVRLSISDLGRLTGLDRVRWRENAATPPAIVAYLDPDGPDSVAMLVSELAGVRTFTVSFDDGVVGADDVAAALDDLCGDPIALFDSVVGVHDRPLPHDERSHP